MGNKATYGWDDVNQVTVLQREKEEAHDYRYFPDPDLVPVEIDETWLGEIRSRLCELPIQMQMRFVSRVRPERLRRGRPDGRPRDRRVLRPDRQTRRRPQARLQPADPDGPETRQRKEYPRRPASGHAGRTGQSGQNGR
jgi:hypothetical protein